MAGRDQFFGEKALRGALYPFLKVGLVSLLLAGCVDTPTIGIPGTEGDNLLPSAVILSPPKGGLNLQIDSTDALKSNLFSKGAEILFSGIGLDPEDDSLSAGSLQWSSDIDGELGTGALIAKPDLSSGTHWIFLTATDSQGATARDSVQVTVGEVTDRLPLAPTDLVALVKSATSILLSWQDNSDNEAHFVIEQRIPGLDTDFALSTTVEKNNTSVEITGLEPGTLYEFRVYAENTSGASEQSNLAETRTLLEEVVEETLELLAPSNLQALVQSSTSILLNWVDNSDNETHFIVEERIAGGDADFEFSTMVAANDTSVKITELEADTPYEFRVYAYEENSSSASDYSNIDKEKTLIAELLSYVTADNTLDERYPDSVIGGGLISVGLKVLDLSLDLLATEEYWAALQFADLQEYIAGRLIGEATLLLYPSDGLLEINTGTTFAVNPFLEQWDAREITWNNKPKYDEGAQIELPVSLSLLSADMLKIDVTPILQKWAKRELINNGLVVRIKSEDLVSLHADFESLNTGSNEKLHPQLYIRFKD